MKLVIHAGMNKTGSSSIQQSLESQKSPDLTYIKWKSPNHSELFVLLFHEAVTRERYHIFRTQGSSARELEKEREHWLGEVTRQLEANTGPVTVFSGEDISQPTPISGCQNMFDFFSQFFDDIRVVAYVRPPLSFINSSFQQRVQSSGISKINAQSLWPNYRKRFEKFDLVFGTENVELVPFVKDSLSGGDVVRDFWHRIGVECPLHTIPRANEGLSLEALALLFYQRKMGDGIRTGSHDAYRKNNSLIRRLKKVGTQKFSFSGEFLENVFRQNVDDLEWIENRLGQKLADQAPRTDRPISTESELIEVALEQIGMLSDLTVREALNVSTNHPDQVALHLLDCLRNICEVGVDEK